MIIKESSNTYRVSTLGAKEDLFFNEHELIMRLRNRGIWSEGQIQNLISQEVGYETVRPYAKYV